MPTTTPRTTAKVEDEEADILDVGSDASVALGAPGRKDDGEEEDAGLALEGVMDGSRVYEKVEDGVDGLERDAVGVGAMGKGPVMVPVTADVGCGRVDEEDVVTVRVWLCRPEE